MRTFYTVDDLFQFCKDNNFTKFSSKEHDGPLIVQSIEFFESNDSSKDGLLPVKLMACHIGVNRNGSSISEDSMNACKNSFKGRPILGAIYKTDTGEYEFRSHDMKIVKNEDGESELEYIEQPVGVISEIEEPYLEYNKDEDKTYLMVSGNIFEDYSRAAEILKRRKKSKCSVELAIDEMSWNAEENYLSIDKFSFRGVTILGYEQDGKTQIEEGMKGSKITIDSFSEKNNSMFGFNEKLLETLEKLNNALSKFSIDDDEKKGVEKMTLEELMEKYEVTEEDIDFEVDGLSSDELEAAFEEHFKKKKKCSEDEGDEVVETEAKKKKKCDDESDADDGSETGESTTDDEVTTTAEDDDDSDDGETDSDEPSKRKYSVDENGNVTLTWELSHGDIHNAIYQLLYEEGSYPWIVEVYDSNFIYIDYEENKYYKRNYSKDGTNVSLAEEKVQVFSEWLTQAEKDAIASLKADYDALKEFKENYEASEAKAAKDEVFELAEYDEIRESDEFKKLMSDAEKFSVDEIKVKADLLFAAHMKEVGNFSKKTEKTHKVSFKFDTNNKKQTYGKLFEN